MTTDKLTVSYDRSVFESIKKEYFLNPNPKNVYQEIARAQSMLDILIGDVFSWYICGAKREFQLPEAWEDGHATLLKAHREVLEKRTREVDTCSPYTFNSNDPRPPEIPLNAEDEKRPLQKTLPILDISSPWSIRFNHHFIGELHPQGNLLALGASIVASFVNANAITPKVSPSVTSWEIEIVKWMARLIADRTGMSKSDSLKYAEQFGGHIVSGGTVANLTAMFMAIARFRIWAKKSSALPAVRPLVLVSPYSHSSVKRCATILGMDFDRQFIPVKTKDPWFMTGEDLREELHKARALAPLSGHVPILVCSLAGATDSGYVDMLDEIQNEINTYNDESSDRGLPQVRHHVDAAHGGAFLAIRGLRRDGAHLFKGIERADSITMDGHKYFYCSYPCGGIFVRNKRDLKLLDSDMPYLTLAPSDARGKLRKKAWDAHLKSLFPDSDTDHESDLEQRLNDKVHGETLEGSRGTHGMKQLYVVLSAWGAGGLEALLGHSVEMTDILRDAIHETQRNAGKRGPALELVSRGPLNQTLFRYVHVWSDRNSRARIAQDDGINYQIPGYMRRQVRYPVAKGAKRWPFYVGTDQVPSLVATGAKDQKLAIIDFIKSIWSLHETPSAPTELELKAIWKYLRPKETGQPPAKINVLKAVVTHPYTDEKTIHSFVRAVLATGKFVGSR